MSEKETQTGDWGQTSGLYKGVEGDMRRGCRMEPGHSEQSQSDGRRESWKEVAEELSAREEKPGEGCHGW